MPRYFGRQYRIEFFDENDESLRVIDSREDADPLQIQFQTETSFGGIVSKMDLSVINLNKDSIGQIVNAKKILFQAGYPDAFGVIFQGKISNIATPREGTERRTTVYCWSGVKEQQDRLCEVSFAPETPYSDIVDFVANDYFQAAPEYIGFSDEFKEMMGKATDGYNGVQPHKIFLNNLAYDHKFQWMVQNEKCILMERGASRGGDQYKIDQSTGLVGGVSLTFLGADFEMKLNPKIQVGDRVKIESKAVTINFSSIYNIELPKEKTTIGDGDFVVKSLRRNGDFYGNNSWKTAFVCWREGETGLTDGGVPLGD